METRTYSCVIIGSSPICLIEAIYQSKFHEKVLVVESDNGIGGAWRAISYFNVADVEIGPHIIYSSCDNRDVYEFLNHLGISLESVSPAPVCVLSGRFLGIKKIALRHYWITVVSELLDNLRERKNSSSAEFRRLIVRTIIAIIKQLLGFYARPMYPRKGSAELIAKLASMLDANGVEIKLNTKVSSLEIDRTNQTAFLRTNNSVIVASKVIITSHASLTGIYENGTLSLGSDFQTDEYSLIHLLLKDAQPSTFSYVRFSDNKLLVRMSDLTKYARFYVQAADLRIFCLHIHRGFRSNHDSLETIFAFLKRHNYVGANASIVDYRFADRIDAFLTGKTMDAISKRYPPIVEPVRTDDNLSYAISANLKRWRAIICSTGLC
jgi:hypothetical protein